MDELCGGALQLLSPLWDPPPTQETFWHFPFRGAHPLFLCLLTWMSLLMHKKSHRPSSLNVCHFACIIINDASCQEIIRIAVIISANCKSKFVTGHVGQPVRPPPDKFVVTEPALIKKDTWGHIQPSFRRPKLDIFTGDLWDTSGCLCGNQTRYFKPNH